MQKLKVGDYVKDILTGKVGEVDASNSTDYPLKCRESNYSFTFEGFQRISHIAPRFIKVDPPKKMVKKTIQRWATIYDYGVSYHETEAHAESNARRNASAIAVAVPFTIEFEVEE